MDYTDALETFSSVKQENSSWLFTSIISCHFLHHSVFSAITITGHRGTKVSVQINYNLGWGCKKYNTSTVQVKSTRQG